jgi:hypothetical protein
LERTTQLYILRCTRWVPKTILLSLMATVSALPYTLFTLPAGAVADMVDRKKILLGVQLWQCLHACQCELAVTGKERL